MSVAPEFINGLTETLSRVEETVRAEFAPLDADQLDWRPGEGRWSIGQCLDHLVKAKSPYLAIFESVQNGTKRTTFWERLPVMPNLWGSLLLNSVKPETKRKMRAPKIFTPASDPAPPDIVETFGQQQDRLRDSMDGLAEVDLDRCIITSPVASFITYSVRHACAMLVAHDQRHLIQAQNVLSEMKSAKNS